MTIKRYTDEELIAFRNKRERVLSCMAGESLIGIVEKLRRKLDELTGEDWQAKSGRVSDRIKNTLYNWN